MTIEVKTGRRQASRIFLKRTTAVMREKQKQKYRGTSAFDAQQDCRPDSEIRLGTLINWKQHQSLFGSAQHLI
jgi:hypothetical protein